MLRIRYAVERASSHRWLGLAVMLLVAVLLVLLMLHFAEHLMLDAAALICVLVAVVFTLLVSRSPATGWGQRRVGPVFGRAPPVRARSFGSTPSGLTSERRRALTRPL
ncbi:MAG: hypothetical protein H0V94_09245 [Actinobacteria bacterium]|nr:hypothetical protein [Actinomycetota bacterium]